jgi:hypothetical protein
MPTTWVSLGEERASGRHAPLVIAPDGSRETRVRLDFNQDCLARSTSSNLRLRWRAFRSPKISLKEKNMKPSKQDRIRRIIKRVTSDQESETKRTVCLTETKRIDPKKHDPDDANIVINIDDLSVSSGGGQ